MVVITIGVSTCAICNELLEKNDELVATTHFIADMGDLLWRCSDAAMHKQCFLAWTYRKRFIAKYNNHQFPRKYMKDDGSIVYSG